MEKRFYFVLGDVVSNGSIGALAGALLSLIFGPDWNMFIAMITGMVLGMIISLPFAFLFGALFGAMEIMLPVMTTGMAAGMVVSMGATMKPMSLADGAYHGLASGVSVFVITYVLNAFIKPRAAKWTK